jgi:histidine ammonia-lyase
MGGWAARKALQVVENVENVLAIEMMAAVQGLEFHRPLKTTEPLENVYQLVREVVKPLDEDRYMKPDLEHCVKMLQTCQVWNAVQKFIPEKFQPSNF